MKSTLELEMEMGMRERQRESGNGNENMEMECQDGNEMYFQGMGSVQIRDTASMSWK